MWPDLGAVRDGLIFNFLNMIAGILWTVDRIMMMVSAILHWFRVLLVGGGGQDNLLGLLMTQLLQGNELLKQLVYLGIMLAFTILAFTLIARPLIGRFQAVEFNKVILWFFIAVIIFSAGPGMVAGLESARTGLQEQAHLIASTIQYQNEVNRYNNQVVPNTVGDFWLPGQTPGYVPHLFGTAVGSNCPSGCNGLDAAAAFLGAEEGDITGGRADSSNTGGYPRALYDRFFTWRDGNEEERSASLRNAKDGVMRLLEGTLPALFSIVEAAIFLLFGIAAMVLFISLPVAIPFAFFSLTEVIAASVLRAYLFLVLRTFVAATMLAFLVQMLIIFAQRGTALVFVSIAALTMMLSFQFVRMAASTVTGALNVIGSAVGSATGVSVRQTDPFAAAGRVAGMAALAGAAVATGGGAMIGAAALLHRQGGLRGGGLSAVGSAALHAARVRSGAVVGRTPLAGLERGYSAVQGYHQQAREQTYQLEAARALLLDRDADEAAAILMDQTNATPHRKEWARKKVSEWTSVEESRQKYRQDMRAASLGRLAWRGYSRPWKPLGSGDGAGPVQPGARAAGETETATTEAAVGSAMAPGAAQNGGGSAGNIAAPHSGYEAKPEAEGVGQAAQAAGFASGSGAGAGPIGKVGVHTQSGSSTPDPVEPVITSMLRFRGNDPGVRAAADEALLMENTAIALAGGYLVVYRGARSEDDPALGGSELVPASADLLDLLRKGKHVQKSRKRPGFLVAWEPQSGEASGALSGLAASPVLTMWSGLDGGMGHRVLGDVRELADQVSQGQPLNASALHGKLTHLSADDRQRLVDMLQGGVISPESMLRVLDATNQVADSLGGAGSAGGAGSQGDPQAILGEFLGPDGYLDLGSPGAASVLSLAASSGADVHIRAPGAPNAEGSQSSQGIPAEDVALLISAGLGLKRALSWAQVKGAIVQASLSDASDPVQAVSESLSAPSLRTSTAPIKRFVETARNMGMSAADVSTALEVATAARDMGAVIAALGEKDEAARHTRWHAAGLQQDMLQPLERARSNALRHASRLSPPGTAGHKTREIADEMLGSLLAEGMTISDELYSVPLETYSGHPFTAGASGAGAALAAGDVSGEIHNPPAAMPRTAGPGEAGVARAGPGQSASSPPGAVPGTGEVSAKSGGSDEPNQ